MKVYHDNAKIYIELDVTEAKELRDEIGDLTGLAEGYTYAEDLFEKLYRQTQN